MCTRSTIVLAIGLALAAVLGCGTTLIVQPDWYDHTGLRLEADTVRVVGRCDASESRSEAVRQADADGRRQISESIQTEIASEASERSLATTGDRLDSRARSIFESATQAVSRTVVSGLTRLEVHAAPIEFRGRELYESRVLLAMPASVYEDAVKRAIEAVQLRWLKDDELVFASAQVAFRSGDYLRASRFLEMLTARRRDDLTAQLLLGESRERLLDPERALDAYDLVVRLGRGRPEAVAARRFAAKIRNAQLSPADDDLERRLRELDDPDLEPVRRRELFRSYLRECGEQIGERLAEALREAGLDRVVLVTPDAAGRAAQLAIPALEEVLVAAGIKLYTGPPVDRVAALVNSDVGAVAATFDADCVIRLDAEQMAVLRVYRADDHSLVATERFFLPAAPTESSELFPTTARDHLVLDTGIFGRRHDGRWFSLQTGDTLRSGEGFRVNVRLNRPAYVYVIDLEPEGTAYVVFPPAGRSSRVESDRIESLPGNSLRDVFRLNTRTGEERLIVVASVTPLEELEELLERRTEDRLDSEDARLFGTAVDRIAALVHRGVSGIHDIESPPPLDLEFGTESGIESSLIGRLVESTEGRGAVVRSIPFRHK